MQSLSDHITISYFYINKFKVAWLYWSCGDRNLLVFWSSSRCSIALTQDVCSVLEIL